MTVQSMSTGPNAEQTAARDELARRIAELEPQLAELRPLIEAAGYSKLELFKLAGELAAKLNGNGA